MKQLGVYSVFAAAMLEKKNNRIPFHWEKSFIFMLIVFIVLLVQHGRHEHTLLPLTLDWMLVH